jgi:hypothetical protein
MTVATVEAINVNDEYLTRLADEIWTTINLSKEHAHKKVSYGEEDAIMQVSQGR